MKKKYLDHLFEVDYEYNEEGDIATETAKDVIVKFFEIMKKSTSDNEAFQDAFDQVVNENQLDNDRAQMVVSQVKELASEISILSTRVRVK